jgi:predicted helicase
MLKIIIHPAVGFRLMRQQLSLKPAHKVVQDFYKEIENLSQLNLFHERAVSPAFEYRLGNRSALDWVIDQYRVTEDKRSKIVNDPNDSDDPQYIVRLVKKVVTVSVETVRVVKGMLSE